MIQNQRHHVLLVLLLGLAFAEMAWLGYLKYASYSVRYFDLGAMSQAVWSATQGEALIFTGQGLPLSRLARNVEFFYFLLAPLYALFPSPTTLIVAQAGLYGLGAIPLFRWAKRRLENGRFALLLCAIYLFYPAAQTAVLFEVHGDTFAMPLLLFALNALDQQAWKWYGFWLLLALSAKFYVAAPVAALGVMLLLDGRRRVGWATLAAGVVWGLFSFFVVFPYFAPPGPEAEAARATIGSYLNARFVGMDLANTAVLRLTNAVIILMPALIVLGWRAPKWLLPAAAIVLPALFSVGFGPSYSYRTHHYAVAIPFLVAAVLAAAAQQKETATSDDATRPAWQGRLWLTLLVVVVFNLAFVDTPFSPFARIIEPRGDIYTVSARDQFKDRWLEQHVPADRPIAASCVLATPLVNRPLLYLTFRPVISPLAETIDQVDFVLTDALYDQATGDLATGALFDGGIAYEQSVIGNLLNDGDFRLVAAQDGLVLFGREGDGLAQSVTVAEVAKRPLLQATFAEQIGLVASQLTPLGERRYRLETSWVLANEPLNGRLVAVSQLAGVEHSRIVHLPTMTTKPTETWQPNELIVEVIEFTLPDGVENGRYPLQLGWYDSQNLFASETDGRSRVGELVELAVLTVP